MLAQNHYEISRRDYSGTADDNCILIVSWRKYVVKIVHGVFLFVPMHSMAKKIKRKKSNYDNLQTMATLSMTVRYSAYTSELEHSVIDEQPMRSKVHLAHSSCLVP